MLLGNCQEDEIGRELYKPQVFSHPPGWQLSVMTVLRRRRELTLAPTGTVLELIGSQSFLIEDANVVHHELTLVGLHYDLLGSHRSIEGVVVLQTVDGDDVAVNRQGVAAVVLVGLEGEVEVFHLEFDELAVVQTPLGVRLTERRLVLVGEVVAEVGASVAVEDASPFDTEDTAVFHDIGHGCCPFGLGYY